jgi:dTDP-4-dehydrorhamnose reductase
MKRIAVLGATGMAGHLISLYLEEEGFEVFRTSRSITPSATSRRIDATDFSALLHWLNEIQPMTIINAIGLLQRECDARPDRAILINAYLPHLLEQHFRDSTTKLIHLSTDCVFSGEAGGYMEGTLPDGRTMYDRSKALGEVVNSKDLTFRMSIVGPDIDPNATGLFHWFMNQCGKIRGFTKAIWNGITTIELSKAIVAAIQQDITGLYHLTSNENISKHDLLQLFQNEFLKHDVEITPFDDFVVNKTLINTRTDFAYQIPSYQTMISEMAKWVIDHKGLYQYVDRGEL